jgi:hypothetical protein
VENFVSQKGDDLRHPLSTMGKFVIEPFSGGFAKIRRRYAVKWFPKQVCVSMYFISD